MSDEKVRPGWDMQGNPVCVICAGPRVWGEGLACKGECWNILCAQQALERMSWRDRRG